MMEAADLSAVSIFVIVDSVLSPSWGERRINELISKDYSTYQSKAAASKYWYN
jgi:hypothetical protein